MAGLGVPCLSWYVLLVGIVCQGLFVVGLVALVRVVRWLVVPIDCSVVDGGNRQIVAQPTNELLGPGQPTRPQTNPDKQCQPTKHTMTNTAHLIPP
jgi:hypothetical protein